jgi:serine/threonine protein kinase
MYIYRRAGWARWRGAVEQWLAACLVMDFMDTNVHRYIKECKGLVHHLEACRIFAATADGLAHLHGRGVTHADLASSNILMNNQGRVCISDFGLSVDASSFCFKPGGSDLVTVNFRGPEAALHKQKITVMLDCWSLGIVGVQLATGTLLFNDLSGSAGTEENAKLLENQVAIIGMPSAAECEVMRTWSSSFSATVEARWRSLYPTDEVSSSLRANLQSRDRVTRPMADTDFHFQKGTPIPMLLAWLPENRLTASAARGMPLVSRSIAALPKAKPVRRAWKFGSRPIAAASVLARQAIPKESAPEEGEPPAASGPASIASASTQPPFPRLLNRVMRVVEGKSQASVPSPTPQHAMRDRASSVKASDAAELSGAAVVGAGDVAVDLFRCLCKWGNCGSADCASRANAFRYVGMEQQCAVRVKIASSFCEMCHCSVCPLPRNKTTGMKRFCSAHGHKWNDASAKGATHYATWLECPRRYPSSFVGPMRLYLHLSWLPWDPADVSPTIGMLVRFHRRQLSEKGTVPTLPSEVTNHCGRHALVQFICI